MITAITPTADRHLAFSLCEKWMKRQTYSGELQWIVADGGKDKVICTCNQLHLKLEYNTSPVCNFHENLRRGIENSVGDKIIFIEDDDWYHPQYIEIMDGLLSCNDLVGNMPSIYYDIIGFRYRENENFNHASLCQTGFRKKIIDSFLSLLHTDPFIDIRLWRTCGNKSRLYFSDNTICLGIKNIPGKNHLAPGSRNFSSYKKDIAREKLISWIGIEDMSIYEEVLSQ